jgi:hypothetical protein
MSADGWVKLWRKLEDSDVWELSPLALRVWVWILLHASREAHTWRGIGLQPGDLITSYDQIAKGVAWKQDREKIVPTVDAIRWTLKTLKSHQALHQEPHQGGLYLKVLHWDQYQSEKPRTTPGTIPVTTPEPHQDHTTIQEEKKKEVKNKQMSVDPEAQVVFEHWKTVMGFNGRTIFDSKRVKAVAWGLDNYGLEDCLAAIDGCAADDWFMGRDPRANGKLHNDLTLILRDADHVERFRRRPKTVLELIDEQWG